MREVDRDLFGRENLTKQNREASVNTEKEYHEQK